VIEFYGPIRNVHIAAVLTSGALFLLRALLVQCGRSGLALAAAPRLLSYAVDTTLLTAAVMLVAILPSAVYANGWLAAKLALLPVYVVLGWLALRARSRARRLAAFAGALLAFGAMYGIARAHDPLGPFRHWTLPGIGTG
jgi:uncharacterized membrane protein SirB2